MLRKLILAIAAVVLLLSLAAILFARFVMYPPVQMPPLLAGLPDDRERATAEIDRRLSGRFPPGTPVAQVIGELEEQRFTVSPEDQWAQFEWSRFPCAIFWTVLWQEDGSAIAAISGKKGSVCL